MERGISWESNSTGLQWAMDELLSAGRFLPTPGLFLCLILAKGNLSLESLWWLYSSCWSLTWRLLQGDNSSEHARFWHFKLLFALLISLMIATSLFLNTQKGNAQGLHCILTNHVDYFGVSVLYRQDPEHACSSKVSPLTPEHIYIFCFVLPNRAVLPGCSPPFFCFHVGQTGSGLLSSLTQFEYHWALRATSAMAQFWPRIFCCISTMEAVVWETLLELPVPKATPMQWSPPSWRGDTGF